MINNSLHSNQIFRVSSSNIFESKILHEISDPPNTTITIDLDEKPAFTEDESSSLDLQHPSELTLSQQSLPKSDDEVVNDPNTTTSKPLISINETGENVTFYLRPSKARHNDIINTCSAVEVTSLAESESRIEEEKEIDRELKHHLMLSDSSDTDRLSFDDAASPQSQTVQIVPLLRNAEIQTEIPVVSDREQTEDGNETCETGQSQESSTKQVKTKIPRHMQPSSREADDESESHFLSKTEQQILYEIATGKWSSSELVLDEDNDGTKGLDYRPCSNAFCVLEAERQKRRMQSRFTAKDDGNNSDAGGPDMIFDEGALPSYHSLLALWKERQVEWVTSIFKDGMPKSESEFLKVWRQCRRNPEAYGIQIKQSQELPELDDAEHIKKDSEQSRCTTLKTDVETEVPNRKHEKKKISVVKKYDPELRSELLKMKQRYESLQSYYRHLPPLTKVNSNNKNKLKALLKQAEDWHRLAGASSKLDLENSTLQEALPQGLTHGYVPRYASNTRSFLRKINKPNHQTRRR